MIDAGTARAVMGNHEFNALLYHTKGRDGEWLRPHSENVTSQHQATLNQIALPCPAEWKDWLNWMLQLPLWLDLGSCRVVHAAWDDAAVQACGTRDTLAEITLAKAGRLWITSWTRSRSAFHCKRRQTPEGSAVNWLLKGPEYKLGDGAFFVDKEGSRRKSVRAKWWIPIRPRMTHAEAAVPAGEIRGEGRVPDGVSFPGYGPSAPPVFFGHYSLTSKAIKDRLASNVACLDYSTGYRGPLVAYRFDGEQGLNPDKFVAAE